ncbi:hypothetical protein [Rubrivivax gelatinosus]|uniref:Uncharacterized protein n=1 Tax=Rubrivivax gelatinosus TaxID=28068 RepID=A0ABS1DQ36_RUBGE|nr:hypothetical protein [Rubrivivax gelatinosus]MBK1711271.1 hypothetical protein [Rubrivivax gelatinosus]
MSDAMKKTAGARPQVTVERGPKGGFRFNWKSLPARGDVVKMSDGRSMVYQQVGPAGMVLCTDEGGAEHLLFPSQIDLVIPGGEASNAD